MHNNLLKSGNILKQEETRVIDSNSRVAERLQYLSEILQNTPEDDFYDDFSAGLDAVQVEHLVGDPSLLGDYQDLTDDELLALAAEANQGGEMPAYDTAAFDQMRVDAEAEVDNMLSVAREEAESIIAAANADAQAILEKAQADGHEQGYQRGYDEGLQIAREAEENCARRESELEAFYSSKIEELEPLFVDKITDIYEHIFMIDLSDKKELVHYLLTDAMRNIEGGKTFLIHVSKEDYEYVLENRDDLTKGLPGTSTLEVIEDITLSQSGCFIEADSGIFDCGLGTELQLLKKELTLLSYKA